MPQDPQAAQRVATSIGRASLARALADCRWDHLMATSEEPDALQGSRPLLIADPCRSGTPVLVAVSRGDAPVAACALISRRRRGLTEVTQLAAAAHRHATGLLWRDPAALDALVAGLARQRGDILRLREIPADSPIVRAVLRRCPDARVTSAETGYVVDLTAPTPVPARIRREVRRAGRRAAERGSGVVVRVTTDADDIASLVPSMRALAVAADHAGPSAPHLTTSGGRAHLTALWCALASQGRLHVATVTVAGDLAAFAAVAVLGDVGRGHVMAFDRGRADVADLGWMALVGMVDHLSHRGIRLLDLGSGGDAHKRRIATARDAVDIRVPLSRVGRLAAVAADARRSARRRLGLSGSGPAGDR